MKTKAFQFKPGELFDGYEIIDLIGEGGMGQVYSAVDSALGRNVAIKILSDEFVQNSDALARFRLEAKSVAKITHKNIVSVFTMNTFLNHHYIVMEYVDGIPLSDYINTTFYGVFEVESILRQILLGVSAAHGELLLHRDIKPDNIMIDQNSKVKILDFGIAKDFGSSSTDNITKAHEIWGTIEYMAPEVLRGAPPSIQSDIFSIGVTFYQLLCSKKPFSGKNNWEVMDAIQKTKVCFDQSITHIIPINLLRIAHKMLANNQKDRYSNITEILADLNLVDIRATAIFPERSPVGYAYILNGNQIQKKLIEQGFGKLEANTIIARAYTITNHQDQINNKTTPLNSKGLVPTTINESLIENIIEEFQKKKMSKTRQHALRALIRPSKYNIHWKSNSHRYPIKAIAMTLSLVAIITVITLSFSFSETDDQNLTKLKPVQRDVATNDEKKAIPDPSVNLKLFISYIMNQSYGTKIQELPTNTPFMPSQFKNRIKGDSFIYSFNYYSARDFHLMKSKRIVHNVSLNDSGSVVLDIPGKKTHLVLNDNPFVYAVEFKNSHKYGSGTTSYSSDPTEMLPLKVGNWIYLTSTINGTLESVSKMPIKCHVSGKAFVTLEGNAGAYNTYKVQCRWGDDRMLRYFSPQLGSSILTIKTELDERGWTIRVRKLINAPARLKSIKN